MMLSAISFPLSPSFLSHRTAKLYPGTWLREGCRVPSVLCSRAVAAEPSQVDRAPADVELPLLGLGLQGESGLRLSLPPSSPGAGWKRPDGGRFPNKQIRLGGARRGPTSSPLHGDSELAPPFL